ncbi:MAG: aminofutalosine synthase MqnE [Candidatus Omnitrophica bacterium]|nr:aminofutalosine synthase MqnE [Candidatus Omnitrophota bacterium]
MNLIWKNSELSDIAGKVFRGERITPEDALVCLGTCELNTLGYLADFVRKKKCGEDVCYSVYLNINHTNLCYLSCQLCAFKRTSGEEGAYTLSVEEVHSRVRKALEEYHINEVHIVGGLTYEISFEMVLEMIRRIRSLSGDLFIKAFTAVEIDHFARQTRTSWKEVLGELKEAGLSGMPGGGAEIFAEPVRSKIARGKISGDKWLAVMKEAHENGVKTNATMLYGHIESAEDIADHMNRLRRLQDETNGFSSFIPLAFQPDNTELEAKEQIHFTDGITDLKIYATARIFLDNFPHIKAYWTTLGIKIAQVALSFGVDDLGGTAIDEKIMHDAGAKTPVSLREEELVRLIRSSGRLPRRVDSSYALSS